MLKLLKIRQDSTMLSEIVAGRYRSVILPFAFTTSLQFELSACFDPVKSQQSNSGAVSGAAQTLGTGIYVLIGVWVGFLAIFAISARILRARQMSLAVLLPLLILPVIITLILVFYPRFPSKQAELQEYERREATAAAFKAYYYRDIRIALVVICSAAAVLGLVVYTWITCLDTWHPKLLHSKQTVTARQKRSN